MRNFAKYAVTVAMFSAIPVLALAALTQPTVPVGGGNAVTATTIETLINQIVNFLIFPNTPLL